MRWILPLLLILTSNPAVAETMAEQILREAREACEEAKVDLSYAKGQCAKATKECDGSVRDAKRSCETDCDRDAADKLALCNKQDNAVVWSCRDRAIEAQEYCAKGCQKADYITSECNTAKGDCAAVAPAQAKKDRMCK